MRGALVHRGPDDAGELIDGQVSLAHRRLAVVDLAGGQQPMSSRDGTLTLVYNGEIYNHPDLRRQFERDGAHYQTQADTESILQAYERYGLQCVEHLHGMFAFVLYDRRRQLLFGARDRVGKKPLYYTTRPFGRNDTRIDFAFASEVESLRRCPAIAEELRLSADGIVDYLLNDYVVGAGCIYEGVARLEAGQAFTYGLSQGDRFGLQTWRYDEWPSLSAAEDIPSLDDAADRLLGLLDDAVERRLMADVPLGAFLSGGIDSTTVVALLTRHRPAAEIKTFCIGFNEPGFDESTYADEVARYLGTDHATWRFGVDEFRSEAPRIARMLDEPLADPSLLPYSMLCEAARREVTVALGGDGGDELLAGYDPFHAVWPAEAYHRLVPNWLHRSIVQPLAGRLPASSANLSWSFKLERFLRGAKLPPGQRLAAWMGSFSLDEARRLLPDWQSRLEPEYAYRHAIDALRASSDGRRDPIDRALLFFQRFYLVDDILVKADRASMMHSLEVRSPFLDRTVIEFVNRLPTHYKYRLRGLTTKHLLKHAVGARGGRSPLVPPSIARRKKKGFGIPLGAWIRGPLRDDFNQALCKEWPAELDMFDRARVRELLNQHLTGKRNRYKELWSLYMLAEWSRHHR